MDSSRKDRLGERRCCVRCSRDLSARSPPYQDFCGHSYCRACVEEGRERGELCPQCQKEGEDFIIGSDEVKPFKDNAYLRNLMPNMQMSKCSHEGCDWFGNINGLNDHENDCDQRRMQCKVCGDSVFFRNLRFHNQRECRYREVICHHCRKTVFFECLLEHYQECTEFPKRCEECQSTLLRRQMDQHQCQPTSRSRSSEQPGTSRVTRTSELSRISRQPGSNEFLLREDRLNVNRLDLKSDRKFAKKVPIYSRDASSSLNGEGFARNAGDKDQSGIAIGLQKSSGSMGAEVGSICHPAIITGADSWELPAKADEVIDGGSNSVAAIVNSPEMGTEQTQSNPRPAIPPATPERKTKILDEIEVVEASGVRSFDDFNFCVSNRKEGIVVKGQPKLSNGDPLMAPDAICIQSETRAILTPDSAAANGNIPDRRAEKTKTGKHRKTPDRELEQERPKVFKSDLERLTHQVETLERSIAEEETTIRILLKKETEKLEKSLNRQMAGLDKKMTILENAVLVVSRQMELYERNNEGYDALSRLVQTLNERVMKLEKRGRGKRT